MRTPADHDRFFSICESQMTTTAGAGLAGVTYAFVPPEALMGTNFSTASDMYALGIIICMIGTGASPYGETMLPAVMVRFAVPV